MPGPYPEPTSESASTPASGLPDSQLRDDVDARLRRMSRRGFVTAGAGLIAGIGGWQWLRTRSVEGGLPWPLRRALEGNEAIARVLFRPDRLDPDFPRDRARMPRVNGLLGMADVGVRQSGVREWRLRVLGGDGEGEGEARWFSLDELKALPRVEQVTELKCIEGWSTVVHWAGARLADLAAMTGLSSRGRRPYDPLVPPGDLLEYVALETPDRGYYVGIDMPGALHAQTLLCYEMDGRSLSPEHGAPLRLVIPVKYGIKNIKRIGTIRFTDHRPPDFWAERGYDWYAGH